MPRVFVSSVRRGLVEVRDGIVKALRAAGHDVVNMEDFGARPRRSLEVCLEEVRLCEALVLLVGPVFGNLVPGKQISYTQAEFEEALRRGIPVLAFRLPAAPHEVSNQRLRTFYDRVAEHVVFVEANENLPLQVVAEVSKALSRGDIGTHARFFRDWKHHFRLELADGEGERRRLNHLAPLVGRKTESARLNEVVQGLRQVIFLSATGGAGKSRLLLELSRQSNPQASSVPRLYFASADAAWQHADVSRLPTDPCVIICDDAHRRADLDRLVRACLDHNPANRFILSTRPFAIDAVRTRVTSQFPPLPEDALVHLTPLTEDQSIELARHVLRHDLKWTAKDLVRAAGRNPLIITVGADCMNSNRVPPLMLTQSPTDFRRIALEQLLRDPCFDGAEGGDRRRVLSLVASIGPIPLGVRQLHERMGAFLQLKSEQVATAMAQLESDGFIARRGPLGRVTPDLLGDHLLACEALDAMQVPTGYVDRLVESFGPDLLNRILANAAELDWRLQNTGSANTVLARTWDLLVQRLPGQTRSQQLDVLHSVQEAIWTAPDQVRRIVDALFELLERPEKRAAATDGWAIDPKFLRSLLVITLGRLAHHPEHTIYCLPRLLDAALTDERPSDYDPQHPRRMVMDLLKHRGQDGGPLQKITMDWLVQRLEQQTTGPNGPWAVTALATVLSRSGEIVRFEGRRMSLGGFSLAPLMHHIADRRAAVLRLLRRVGGGAEIGQGAAAIKALENLLHRPFPPFGGVVPPEQVAVWEPEARKAADLLAEIAGRGESPVLRYAARRALRSSTHDHWPEAAKHVIEALAGTPPSPDEPLYDLLASEPLTERDPDRTDKTSPAERPAKRVARALWQSYQTPIAVLQRLSGAITEIAITVGVNGVGRPFLGRAVVGARVPQAPALVDALLALPPAQSLCLVADIVGGLAEHCDRGLLKDAVARLAASPVESLRGECAQGLWWLPHRSNGTPADFAFMDPFISDPSPTVRLAAANALMAFAHIDEDRSIDYLLSIEWDGREDIADTVCSRFASWGEPPTLSLSDERIDRLLLRIETLPSLDHRQHTVAQFIAGASFDRPLQTVEMLLRRVQRADSPPDSPSRPVEAVPDPSHGSFRLHGLARSAEFPSLLRRIRDISLVPGDVGQHAAKNLFQAAATNVTVAVDALREWVESGDSVRILRCAEMLPGLHHSRVFTLRDFVADILEAAAAAGTDCLQRVSSALWAISIGGVFSATEGEPPPRHLDDKAQAEQLAEHFADRPVVAAFYRDLAKSSQRSIERHVAEWAEEQGDW